MNLVDVILGLLGIVMVVRFGQLFANANRRKSTLRLGKEIFVVIITLILIVIYFYSRFIG
jgi:hypothetical protein